jgi:hypothetical protein
MNRAADSLLSRLALWLVALVYGLSMPGVAPTLMVSLSALGDDHPVEMVFDHGHLDLVLHHDEEPTGHDEEGAVSHQHDQDHVLHFESDSEMRSTTSTRLSVAAPMSVHLVCVEAFVPARLAVSDAVRPQWGRAQPGASAVMRCLRTTVILV